MTMSTDNPVSQYAVRLADDALILGHRLSEWCSRGPFLEEDLALSNVALDYIGRARMFYGYAAELSGDDRSEDDFAFLRDCRDFGNLLIHELPRGDFAFTMARQYLVDVHSVAFMTDLQSSTDATLAAIAGKAVKESNYHLRRSRDWMLRLGGGTEESHRRLQHAVDELWGFTPEMFEMDELEKSLAGQGVAVDVSRLQPAWDTEVRATLAAANMSIPEEDWQVSGGRQGKHTEWLGHLLSDLQFMQRAYPGLEW
ncbi:MAG: phenylacetate-CoA oxygenase subunit PaaC [Gammaproteobacteria bacterium]|nr:phenylacetate-CoA oxygenase subunit PaaC [Gammaproteobacteria bacterium]